MVQRALPTYQSWKSDFIKLRARSPVPWAKTPLGKLPQELRDEIYGYYYTVPGGYVVNPSTIKLRAANGKPIDLSLGSVCLALRAETMGVAFKMNDVHATTTSPESEFSASAARWSQAVRLNHLLDCETLRAASSLITEDVRRDILEKFPGYGSVLENLNRGTYCFASGSIMSTTDGPSTERKFLQYALDLIQRQPGFLAKVGEDLFKLRTKAMLNGPSSLDYWRMTNEPGSILDPITLPRLRTLLGAAGYTIHSFSAAAVMIVFLARYMQLPVFTQIRQVHLHEDRPSAAYPECHTEPFVNFLAINPNLKVHRHVSLWRNVWASVCKESGNGVMDLNDILSETMFRWMNEAEQVIASVGGGRKVFKLEFDCDGMPDIAKEMFDLAQEGAAWQVAIGLSLQKIGSSGDALESGFLKLFSWDPSGLLHDKLHRMEDPASLSCSNFRFGMDSELRDSILQNDWSRQKYTEFFRRRKTCNSRWEKLWRVQTAGESFSDPIILD